MKNKVNLLIITAVVTVVVFIISTNVQKKLIDYVPSVKCLVLSKSIAENEKVDETMFTLVDVPISIIPNARVVQSFEEIDGLYATDNILINQIAMREQFDTKENLSIYEAENGLEKISIKVEAAENGMSYSIKENSYINVYATLRNDIANNFLLDNERMLAGDEYDGYTVIKILDRVKVLGAFNIDGIKVDGSEDGVVDTIMVGVTSDEAKEISLIRNIASFNITGVKEIQMAENADILGGSSDEEIMD